MCGSVSSIRIWIILFFPEPGSYQTRSVSSYRCIQVGKFMNNKDSHSQIKLFGRRHLIMSYTAFALNRIGPPESCSWCTFWCNFMGDFKMIVYLYLLSSGGLFNSVSLLSCGKVIALNLNITFAPVCTCACFKQHFGMCCGTLFCSPHLPKLIRGEVTPPNKLPGTSETSSPVLFWGLLFCFVLFFFAPTLFFQEKYRYPIFLPSLFYKIHCFWMEVGRGRELYFWVPYQVEMPSKQLSMNLTPLWGHVTQSASSWTDLTQRT